MEDTGTLTLLGRSGSPDVSWAYDAYVKVARALGLPKVPEGLSPCGSPAVPGWCTVLRDGTRVIVSFPEDRPGDFEYAVERPGA